MSSDGNLIKNGGFDDKSADWSGKDIEAHHKENAYLRNGEDNRVAELDGKSGQETVMEQQFKVSGPATTELTFDSALRNAAMDQVGENGFTVEILNPDGQVIADMIHLPDDNEMQEYSMPVTFDCAGTYTLRFTEFGNDDSLGAIIDNVSIYVCFVRGSMVACDTGEKPVETIEIGDLVKTMDHGLQPVRWVGSAKLAGIGANAPVCFQKNTIGNRRELLVSPQHRMLLKGWQAEILFGKAEVLASAISLVNDQTIQQKQMPEVEYFHILFDRHEIIFAEGAASESFHPGIDAVSALEKTAKTEVLALFPELAYGDEARLCIDFGEGKLAQLSGLSA